MSLDVHTKAFLVGPAVSGQSPLSQHTDLGDGRWLSAHASLPTTVLRHETGTWCLIGYALDPHRPTLDDPGVLADLVDQGAEQLPGSTSHLGGRWILLAPAQSGIAFADAAGLRQLMRYRDPGGGVWLGSSDTLLAREFDLDPDPVALDWQRRHQGTRPRAGSWFPGYRTGYLDVRQVLPNHLLELSTGLIRRWWPHSDLSRVDEADAASGLGAVLRGQLRAAEHRGLEPTLLLTSGRDSRLLLSAALTEDVSLRAITLAQGKPDAGDSHIPQQLAALVGLEHESLRAPAEPSADFWQRYVERTPRAQPHYAANAEAMMPSLGQRLAVTGHVSGIAKRHYRGLRGMRPPKPDNAARSLRLDGDPFVFDALEEWLAGVGVLHGFDIEDLLYWEQRSGTWLAAWMHENDLVWSDVLSPFNNRDLLVMLLGVDHRLRSGPHYQLWHHTNTSLAPETLSLPIGGESSPSLKTKALVKARRAVARRKRA